MNAFEITCASDIARITANPYADFMPHGSVYNALDAVAQSQPERRALTFISIADPAIQAQSWSYAQLMAQVRRTANLFHTLAGEDEPRIAMLLPAIPQAYFTLFGGETAGVVCPINYLLDAEHIAELINASRANILVALGPNTELDIWSRVPTLRKSCPQLRHILAVGAVPDELDFDHALSQACGDAFRFQHRAGPDSLAALFHTGGTTGKPKLAQHTHGNQLHAAWGAAQMYAATQNDVVLNGFPLFHVAGSFVYGLSTFLAGGEVVLPTLLGMRNKAFVERYWTFVERHKVTLLAAVPTIMSSLLNMSPGDANLSSVRALFTGGAPLPDEIAASFERLYGIKVRNILGMTECAGVISIEPLHMPRVAGSCGLPLPFTQVHATTDDGHPLAAGETGVLCVKGPNVGPGYTQENRNPGTFTPDGWLITGDLGHVDQDGRIFVTGRAKDLIIRSSHNIDPRIIEDALLRHPAVLMAAAVGEPDEYAGEIPVAFVSLKPGAQVEAKVLAEYVQQFISERPAFPKRVEILEAMPLTAIGKVYKPALKALATRFAIVQRLEHAGLALLVDAQVVDAASKLTVVFTGKNKDVVLQHENQLRQIMGRFAIHYRITP